MGNTAGGDRINILVVEDNAVLRLHATDLLEQEGFVVLEAPSADLALTVLANAGHDIRLLFTDVQMPGTLDGIELVHKVSERWPHIMLIITSGQPVISPTQLPPWVRVLPKPYQDGDLVRYVRELLHSS